MEQGKDWRGSQEAEYEWDSGLQVVVGSDEEASEIDEQLGSL